MSRSKVDTTKISSDVAEELYERNGGTIGGWKFAAIQRMDAGRWEEHFWLILESFEDGNFYAVKFSHGLTENQDNKFPWRGDAWTPGPETVEGFRVYPEMMTSIVYSRSA